LNNKENQTELAIIHNIQLVQVQL